MKKILIILCIFALFACQQPMDEPIIEEPIEETEAPEEQEAENIPPFVKINEDNCTIANGADAVFTPLIIDQDNDDHTVIWYLDDVEFIRQHNCAFAATPEVDTLYTLTVKVSDGEAEDTDSVLVTVLKPVWHPEPRHIYLYSESVEPDGTNYAKLYIASETNYFTLYNAADTVKESHNQDYPNDLWIIIGGGP